MGCGSGKICALTDLGLRPSDTLKSTLVRVHHQTLNINTIDLQEEGPVTDNHELTTKEKDLENSS